MSLFCLRHGESEYNVHGLCNSDPAVHVALTEKGRVQAEQVRKQIDWNKIGRVYTSRLQRAQETAKIVSKDVASQLEWHIDSRLDDRNSGYEGLPVKEYLNAMLDAPEPVLWKISDGESYVDMIERVHDFLKDLEQIKSIAHTGILIVSHHEILQAISGYFSGVTPQEMLNTPINHCDLLEFPLLLDDIPGHT